MSREKPDSWFERVEELVKVLEDSTIGELELTEGGTEIIIRRTPGVVVSSTPGTRLAIAPSGGQPARRGAPAEQPGVAVIAPLTGVYYSTASPTTPPFASVGDVIQIGQTIALIEAMKVFNEINAEISGRVVALAATHGTVVRKGDVLLRIEPA